MSKNITIEELTIPPGGAPVELIIREGAAAEPVQVQPSSYTIKGDIKAPGNFADGRNPMIAETHVEVSRKDGSITLVVRPNYSDKVTVTGKLKRSDELESLKLGEAWGIEDLAIHMRKLRRFMTTDEAAKVISGLKSFKAKVDAEIEKSSTKEASKISYKNAVEKVVTHNLPETFKMEMPLFEGAPARVFQVEIFVDVRDAGTSVTLESIEAQEAARDQLNNLLEEQIARLAQYVIINL